MGDEVPEDKGNRSQRDGESEVRDDRSVRWAAYKSGGLKSLSVGGHSLISKGGTQYLTGQDGVLGGQGVHREMESEGFEENYRVVINGSYPNDESVGQRWEMVERAL